MKKKPSKAKPPRRSGKAGKSSPEGRGGDMGDIQQQAASALSHAEILHGKVGQIHSQAHQLHESIDQVKRNVRKSGKQTPNPAESADIVTDEKREKAKPFPIVGIGASAGGYEAFVEFLSHLPNGLGMAIILVQHLDPKHKSKLTELLGHTSKVPVLEAKNDMEVKPDTIYVIPENTTMTIGAGRLRLTPRKEREGPPMPIDAFFRSLAAQQQNRGIAVVLSGTGTDGSLGLEAVKGEGGITFAQDEASAKYFGMPGSAISSGSVDFVMPPKDIAKELLRISEHPYVGRAKKPLRHKAPGGEIDKLMGESPNELNVLFNLLRQRKGVDFSLYKQSTLKRRIIRRMILHKTDSLVKYLRLLHTAPAEVDSLFNDLLINVTNFFRDGQTFQTLKKKVFPKILKAHEDDTPLRFWACGCATGEEAYSLAMSLIEFFDRARTHCQVQIFATDISDSSIEKARAGIYPENILQDVCQERLRRFFTRVNGNYQVHKSIRDMCIFARQNVLTDPPFSNLDLITCRNVLIYFGPLLQRKIIPLFHYSLRPTGFLLLGSSETIGAAAEQFSLVDKKHKIYIKKPTFNRPGLDVVHKAQEIEIQQQRPLSDKGPDTDRQDFHTQVDRILLREFSPAAVVINSDWEVMHFRGRTGDYLEHAPGTASLNLLKMARESLAMPLRLLLSKAQKHESVMRQGIELRSDGRIRQVVIEVRPFKLGSSTDHFFLVVFQETDPAMVESPRPRSDGQSKSTRHRGEMSRLQEELNSTKESLQSIIEEQEATNEELKSANEEIQSSNEELQSTNEELETAKEELQSTNEELTTLNEELQNRNTELSTVNNDLANLLASVNVPILMVGTDLTIRRFTPMAEKIFNVIPSDVGRRLADINRTIIVSDLEGIVAGVIEDLATVEREVQDREGHWWTLRIRPYRTRENKIEGAVILLVDIDELRRSLEITLSMVKQPLVMLDADLKIRAINQAFLEVFSLSPREADSRKPFFELCEGRFDIANLRLLLEDILPKNKRVTDYDVEMDLPRLGHRRFKINASRFFEEGRGTQTTLLAAEDVTPKG